MSTKNVKIGLSKDNANQIIGAIATGVLNRLVTQFSTSVAYTKGQYTNYQNTLYRFTADKSAGAWDSTKVEAASFNELVDDVNSAVASVTGKANTADLLNGTLIPEKAVSAKSLEPVSADSGSFQDTPFISQGTGTANGSTSVDTSDVGKHVEKQGNTIGKNQKLVNPDFSTTSNWAAYYYGGTVSIADGILTVTRTNGSCDASQAFANAIPAGHKLLFIVKVKTANNNDVTIGGTGFTCDAIHTTSSYGVYTRIGELTTDCGRMYIACISPNADCEMNVDFIYCIDLTQMFSGDIPQDILDNPENFFRYYDETLAYNTGSLENSNGRYLVCTGRNLWDEISEDGYYDISDGSKQSSSSFKRSKNPICVVPNKPIYFYRGASSGSGYILFFDKNGNYLNSYEAINVSAIVNVPYNASYAHFYYAAAAFANKFTFSLYYPPEQGGEGYDQNYDYVAPKVYDTGIEILRSAKSVKDTKAPDGTITRKIGSYTFTGSESWNVESGYAYAVISNLGGKLSSINIIGDANAITGYSIGGANTNILAIYLDTTTYDTSAKINTLTSGKTIYYELATPTTEEGTPFSENIEINDYGMMYWLDTDNNLVSIPQGCRIFYPAWYAGFLDSLGQREDVDWDASELVSHTELDAVKDPIYENLGGALRHLLAEANSLDFNNTAWVDLGNVSWWYDSSNAAFSVTVTAMKKPLVTSGQSKVVCSLYKTDDIAYSGGMSSAPNMTIRQCADSSGDNQVLLIKNTSYTDATTIKNAMKGILVAVEKASE